MSSQILPFRPFRRPPAETEQGDARVRSHTVTDRAVGPWPNRGVTVVPNMNPELHLVMWVVGPGQDVRIMEYPITGWVSPRGERRGEFRSFPVTPVSFNPFTHDQWALVERHAAQEVFHWPSRFAFPMTREELVEKIRSETPAMP